MASFGAVSFTVDTDSFQESRDARVTLVEIPGGDGFYVDRAGRSPLKLNVNVLLANESAWGALNALLGQEQSLVIETLNTHDAVLMSVSRPAPAADGQVRGTANFLITDA